MTTTPDIIGVVKEIKAFTSDCNSCKQTNSVRKLKTFDAVADALLYAVDALEMIDAAPDFEPRDTQMIYKKRAADALSRIRSLPVQ